MILHDPFTRTFTHHLDAETFTTPTRPSHHTLRKACPTFTRTFTTFTRPDLHARGGLYKTPVRCPRSPRCSRKDTAGAELIEPLLELLSEHSEGLSGRAIEKSMVDDGYARADVRAAIRQADTARLVWGEQAVGTIGDAIRRGADLGEDRSATHEAAEWLEDWLAARGGTDASTEVKKAARVAGHAERTLHRARKQLRVEANSTGFPRVSYWSLPGTSAAIGGGTTVVPPSCAVPRGEGTTGITGTTERRPASGASGASRASHHGGGTTDAKQRVSAQSEQHGEAQ